MCLDPYVNICLGKCGFEKSQNNNIISKDKRAAQWTDKEDSIQEPQGIFKEWRVLILSPWLR